MPSLSATKHALPDLTLLTGLATPLWLVRAEDGGVVWLNRAARKLLYPNAAGGTLRMTPAGPAPTAATERTVTVQGAGGEALALTVRIGPVPGCDLVLVEAAGDLPARQEVARLNEQLVALSYAYPDLRFELRRDGRILDFAAGSPADLGIPAQRFLNGRIQEVLPEAAAAQLLEALERVAAGAATASSIASPTVKVDIRLPVDGETGAEGDAVFEARLVALSDDGDRILCILRNITGRARAEQRAERAHRLLLDAIDSIGEGFVLYDADDRLVLFNRRYRDLKISDPDLAQPGTPFESLLRDGMRRGLYRIPPERAEEWMARRLALHRHGGPPMEVQLADGRWLRIEERRTCDGGTVGLRTDITDLKAHALELAAANRRKSDYVHHLSHELRTPLTAVMGFAEILRDQLLGPPGSPRYGEAAAQIVAAGDYMLELINNLLDLARIEAGRLELHEEECPPALIVDATLAMMAARAERCGVALSARLPADLPVLRGDPSLVRQMLTNLVGNALKFTDPGGHVTVSAERDAAGGLILAVADDGRGMPPERIPQALTAFAQIHDPTRDPMTAEQHGSGLGLPLTAALVELHGGGIAVDSAPGRGTTVRLRFPPERVTR
ncbi:ATP-binding protein [Azospirillum sp. Sh1]|uniref:PAS domain-containing sensor histidine kinase n=1 Tax=Azospirillum sp. Sh1 TaxID=2607285 RepID=UPI0011EFB249|nr:ATP-binding protein [Azospirillum sp. Sh1]KAA0570399.1 PAS domain-containing protein [Azospirillum sp. Sh1]